MRSGVNSIIFSLALMILAQPATPWDEWEYPMRELLIFQEIPVIAASKYAQPIEETPAFVTVITHDEIERYGYNTLGDVLRGIAGMYVTYDRNYEYLGVRGFVRPGDYNTRILLLVNGHSTNEDWIGCNYIGTDFPIDLDMIDRIEVVKGPGSALYGTSAFFSVINVITKRGSDVEGLRASVENSSYGKIKGILSFGNRFPRGVELLASGSWMDVKGGKLYFPEFDSVNGGYTEGTDYDRAYAFQWNLTYRDFIFHGMTNSRKKGIPTAAWDTRFNDPRTNTIDGRSFVEVSYRHPIASTLDLIGRIYWDQFKYEGTYVYDDPGYPVWREAARGDWYGSELKLDWRHYRNSRGLMGVEYQKHRLKMPMWIENDGGEVIYDYEIPDRDFGFWALYLQEELHITNKVNLLIGAHYDHYPTFGGEVNPRLATVIRPWRYGTIKFLYGEAFRAPSVYELYFDDGEMQVGNEELEPEKVKTYECLISQSLPHRITGVLSLYHNRVSNLISQVENEDSMLQYQNMESTQATGIEAELRKRFTAGIHFYTNLAYQRSKNRDTGRELINVPRVTYNLGLSIPVWRDKAYISLDNHYVGRRPTLVDGVWVEPYWVTNLTFTSGRLVRNVRISASIYNLFDRPYEDPGAEEHLMVKIPQNRRVFQVKLSYLFHW